MIRRIHPCKLSSGRPHKGWIPLPLPLHGAFNKTRSCLSENALTFSSEVNQHDSPIVPSIRSWGSKRTAVIRLDNKRRVSTSTSFPPLPSNRCIKAGLQPQGTISLCSSETVNTPVTGKGKPHPFLNQSTCRESPTSTSLPASAYHAGSTAKSFAIFLALAGAI